jgi:hypothetical protein
MSVVSKSEKVRFFLVRRIEKPVHSCNVPGTLFVEMYGGRIKPVIEVPVRSWYTLP